MSTTVLAGDLGGTHFRAGLVAEDGTVLTRDQAPSPNTIDAGAVIETIARLLESVRGSEMPSAVCLAVAGLTSPDHGRVDLAPNIPAFRNVVLSDPLEARLGIPVRVDNDASAAALGEFRFGAGQGHRHLLHATLGTGIGGGIIIDGRLYRGNGGLAGEIGHIILDPAGPRCACNGKGCLEAFVSGTALSARAQRLLDSGKSDILPGVIGDDTPSGIHLREAAHAGDPYSEAEIRNAGHYLGLGIGSVVNVLNPDAVTLSGGLLVMGEMLLGPMLKAMRAIPYGPANRTPVHTSTIGDDCGLLGAAAVALEYLETR